MYKDLHGFLSTAQPERESLVTGKMLCSENCPGQKLFIFLCLPQVQRLLNKRERTECGGAEKRLQGVVEKTEGKGPL